MYLARLRAENSFQTDREAMGILRMLHRGEVAVAERNGTTPLSGQRSPILPASKGCLSTSSKASISKTQIVAGTAEVVSLFLRRRVPRDFQVQLQGQVAD